MVDKKPQKGLRSKDQFISLKEATEETIDALSVRITGVEAQFDKALKDQRGENHGIVIGVLIATVLIIFATAATVIYANYLTGNEYDSWFKFEDKLNAQQIQINDLENVVDNIKVRNPYLK